MKNKPNGDLTSKNDQGDKLRKTERQKEMLQIKETNQTGYRPIKCGNTNQNVALIRTINTQNVSGFVIGIKLNAKCPSRCKLAADKLRKWIQEHEFETLKSDSEPVRGILMRSFGPNGNWEPTFSSYSFHVSAKEDAETVFLEFMNEGK